MQDVTVPVVLLDQKADLGTTKYLGVDQRAHLYDALVCVNGLLNTGHG